MELFDLIIIGGGGLGLATAHQAALRGARVLVLEKNKFMNQDGSSAGFSRQYRIPYPEDYMVKMALDAKPFWDDLQQHTEKQLLDKAGTLWFGDPNVRSTEGNLPDAKSALTKLSVKFEMLNSAQVESLYNFRNLPESYIGLFQPDGASINLVATQETLIRLNRMEPQILLKDRSQVTKVARKDEMFHVSVNNEVFHSKKIVIVPGPYINETLSLFNFTIDATYWEMTSAYYKIKDPGFKYPTWFVFQPPVENNNNQFYGFPAVNWDYPGYIRVAPDFVMKPLIDPSQRTGFPDKEALAFTSAWVKDHMTGLSDKPVHTSTCLVALSSIPNKEMILDFAPKGVQGYNDVVVCATGWAAKFIPLLGKILSDLALNGRTSYDITPFQSSIKHSFRLL